MADKQTYEELEQRVKKLAKAESECKRAKEALRESEEKYRAMYDNSPLPYQSLNEDGCFKDVNPAWLRTIGYRREEVIGKWFGDFLHPDWKAHFEKNFPEFKQRGYVYDVRFKIRHKEGHYLDVSYDEHVGYHPDVSFKQTYCILQDITDRKWAEEALQKAHGELEKRVEERTAELSKVNEKLKNKTINLEEVNTALKVLLEKRDKDKIELEEKVLSNVKELIFPYIENLKMSRLDDRQMGLLGIIESNLKEIITPFLRKLSLKYSNLTPKEIQVAGLVKEGKTSKEIAELLDSNKNAVEFHRKNLRKKLGIRSTKTNLNSYLLSLI